MSTIHWGEWERSPGCREHMDKQIFRGGSYTHIFWGALADLFENKNGDPGLLPKGVIYQHAENLMREREPVGFTLDDMKRVLYFGTFSLRSRGKLLFTGPRLPEHADYYAAATINGNHIWFNFYNMIQYANATFPDAPDEQARDRLKWMTMGVILHEVMHCEGFIHNVRHGFSIEDAYWRTLPALARIAVMDASPYSDAFFLDSGQQPARVRDDLCCGTNS